MMSWRFLGWGRVAVIICFMALLPWRSSAEPLVADISDHLVSISSNFTGTELLLFGAIEEAPGEGEGHVVVVVRGPEQRIVVRKKKRRVGIWVNTKPVTFQGVPGFYAVSSSGPLPDIAPPAVLARQQIGLDNLLIVPEPGSRQTVLEDPERIDDYRDAVIRNMKRDGLYSEETGSIRFLADTLFRTRIAFPANVPVGNYRAEVYLIRDGSVVPGGAQSTPIFIDKVGIERAVFNFAHSQPAMYGIFAILVALLAGWVAAVVFRKL